MNDENSIFTKAGMKIPSILLPKECYYASWSVIACDQFTQNAEYWASLKDALKDSPSSLNIILPEIYLKADNSRAINEIQSRMSAYISSGVFQNARNGVVYVERTVKNGVRRGLIIAIDLEKYSYKQGTSALIRATEATVEERLPVRIQLRRNAALECPHIMLLFDDKTDSLLRAAQKCAVNCDKVYDVNLVKDGGKLRGTFIDAEKLDKIEKEVEILYKKALEEKNPLFLVGDGNHSLAAAKAVWEEKKAARNPSQAFRYALVELVNIHDPVMKFHPIHRAVFTASPYALAKKLSEKLKAPLIPAKSKEEIAKNTAYDIVGLAYKEEGETKFFTMHLEENELAVAPVQAALDECVSEEDKTDYIHGEEEALDEAKKEGVLAVILPPVEKDNFFETIRKRHVLPRKSFSIGEAKEKRYYMECRALY